ncbi:hypothetical protein Dimus_016872 [Dionaea muscipula]
MFQVAMSSTTSLSEEASVSSGARLQDFACLNPLLQQAKNTFIVSTTDQHQQQQQIMSKKTKKKRNLPGNPDPDAEVIALSPKSLLATNRFVCEVCNKGFQRDQNLQLHRRGHNLPWKLKQRNNKEVMKKKAYVCPEPSCVHHHPSRALGDLTGIKKHFCRKHGEKKYKCEKCSKIYAVQSDCKAHSKTCGTREYRCDCGTLFSRKDSFITHRAFCDALAAENARVSSNPQLNMIQPFTTTLNPQSPSPAPPLFPFSNPLAAPWNNNNNNNNNHTTTTTTTMQAEVAAAQQRRLQPPLPPPATKSSNSTTTTSLLSSPFARFHVNTTETSNASTSAAHLSATALLQKACTVGHVASSMARNGMGMGCSILQLDGLVVGSSLGHVAHDHVSVNNMPSSSSRRLMEGHLGATWQRAGDSLTRDFLGLASERIFAGGGGGGAGGGGGGRGGGVEDVLKYAGGVGSYGGGAGRDVYNEGDQYSSVVQLLKQPHSHGFGLADQPAAAATASESWV